MEQITKALFNWATILEEGTRQQAMTRPRCRSSTRTWR